MVLFCVHRKTTKGFTSTFELFTIFHSDVVIFTFHFPLFSKFHFTIKSKSHSISQIFIHHNIQLFNKSQLISNIIAVEFEALFNLPFSVISMLHVKLVSVSNVIGQII
jgi:hypothetical protein